MRNTVLLVLLLAWAAGCADDSYAGSAGAAGDSGSAGTTGSAGTGDDGAAGAAGATGEGGQGGAALPPSCAIPLEQVSGTTIEARFSTARSSETGAPQACRSTNKIVQITNGVYADSSWTRTSFSVGAVPLAGECQAALSFERTTVQCGRETLFVPLTVPAI